MRIAVSETFAEKFFHPLSLHFPKFDYTKFDFSANRTKVNEALV